MIKGRSWGMIRRYLEIERLSFAIKRARQE
jgi:hypothetical protein